jgi:D-glycero-D-manno-heptose 1,7-bisphosphate phosphatase
VRAAHERRLDLVSAVIVGDSEVDMAAGRAVGTATILLADGITATAGPITY